MDTYGNDLTVNDKNGQVSEVTKFERNEGKDMTPIHFSCYGKLIFYS